MTDRVRHLTITLDENLRVDDLEPLVLAIRHIRQPQGIHVRVPQDGTGRPIGVGDRVSWRGKHYTIKGFGDLTGRYGTRVIEFEEPRHLADEVPDEIAVDLVPAAPRTICPWCGDNCPRWGADVCPMRLRARGGPVTDTNAAGETYKDVNAVCPLCHQELTLTIFDRDFMPQRRFTVAVSRLPYHPLPVIAVYDARLAIHCPASGKIVYERCDGAHAPLLKRYPACMDHTCWLEKK